MALAHLLYYYAARYNISVCIVHIVSVNNVIDDCLSRSQQDKFKQPAPLANPTPEIIPVWPIQSFIDASWSAIILV